MKNIVIDIAKRVKAEGGRGLVVGGFVRDKLLGATSKDIDIEVYGIAEDRLKALLQSFGPVDLVGESFAVFKVAGIDVSLPRKESKVAPGHKGFTVEYDPDLSFEEASRRRDFTVNALALDPLTGEILDAHGGQKDLKDKILRAVDAKTFADDPLRALRAVQFAARFEFEIEGETQELCKSLNLKELSPERIGEEWKKLLIKAEKPSIGLEYMNELLILDKLHPELLALIDTLQDQEWHPEGDVWAHVKLSVDAAAKIIRREKLKQDEALGIMLAVLLHDIGKPATTTKDADGRIRSKGHTEAGLPLAKEFMRKLMIGQPVQKVALSLIKEHMFLTSLARGGEKMTARAVRRLAARLMPANIRQLSLVIEADRDGTGRGFAEGIRELLQAAEQLKVKDSKPKPLVTGADLLKLGYKEGPELGAVLKKLYEAQLDGEFESKEEGIKYFQNSLSDFGEGPASRQG